MQVIVDTSVWSLVLRRRAAPADKAQQDAIAALKDLIADARAMLIGPVRQELLCGIKDPVQFERLRGALAAFPDEVLTTQDYERAAQLFNTCKARGVQGSSTDFLICAVALERKLPIFSFDQDFMHFQKCVPIELFAVLQKTR
jgi:predicted nucleic acid-binding protein